MDELERYTPSCQAALAGTLPLSVTVQETSKGWPSTAAVGARLTVTTRSGAAKVIADAATIGVVPETGCPPSASAATSR